MRAVRRAAGEYLADLAVVRREAALLVDGEHLPGLVPQDDPDRDRPEIVRTLVRDQSGRLAIIDPVRNQPVILVVDIDVRTFLIAGEPLPRLIAEGDIYRRRRFAGLHIHLHEILALLRKDIALAGTRRKHPARCILELDTVNERRRSGDIVRIVDTDQGVIAALASRNERLLEDIEILRIDLLDAGSRTDAAAINPLLILVLLLVEAGLGRLEKGIIEADQERHHQRSCYEPDQDPLFLPLRGVHGVKKREGMIDER